MPGKIDKKVWDGIQKSLKNMSENEEFKKIHEKSYKEMKEWVVLFIQQLSNVNEFYTEKLEMFK